MFTNRLFNFLMVIALLLAVACTPQTKPPANTPIPSFTLMPTSTSLPTLTATPTPWLLVAVGNSIPFNSSQDCPGCTGFVDQYAEAIIAATGHPVKIQNLSQHNGLQIDDLLQELKTDTTRRDALANADIIIVAIAHNDIAWNRNDDPCDGSTGEKPDWSKFNSTCAAAAAEIFRPKFESLYAQIVAMRAGKPTVFLALNRYNDWVGTKYSDGSDVPPAAIQATKAVLDSWNVMICKAAEENGFMCADIYHAFNGPDGLKPSSNLLASDWTHPSNKGNEVIAGVLEGLGYAPLMP